MNVFEPSEAGSYHPASVRWEGPVHIAVDEDGVRPTRRDDGDVLVQLNVARPEVQPQALFQLRAFLADVAGVVPEDAPQDEYGAVSIACVDPTQIEDTGLSWLVNDDLSVEWDVRWQRVLLRVAGNDDAFAPWVVPTHHEYFGLVSLTAEDAWRLVRAIASVEAWSTRVESRKGRAPVELLAEARAALLARVPASMFEPDRVVEVWVSVPERPGADFVLRGDEVEIRDDRDRPLAVSVEVQQPELTQAGMEALTEAIAGIGLPNPLPLPLRVPLVEPRLVYPEASWWRVTDDLWLVHRGFESVTFCTAAGGRPPALLDLDGAQAWLLVRSLVSIRILLREARAEAEAAIAVRRRCAMAGLPSAQAPSDKMDSRQTRRSSAFRPAGSARAR